MAVQADEVAPKPQVVGNAFVEQYYVLLSQSPDLAHRFYQDVSVISRPDSDGSMSSATTLRGIDEMILSLDYKDCLFEILTADAQDSFGNGVIILVTGYYTGKDNVKRKFSQLFFLAPQEKVHQEKGGYFVMNDVFRFMDEEQLIIVKNVKADSTAPSVPVTPDPEPNTVSNQSNVNVEVINEANASTHVTENEVVSLEREMVDDHVADANPSVGHVDSVDTLDNSAPLVTESPASNIQEDVPKKSFATIVSQLNFKKQPFQQRASPAKPAKPAVKPVIEPVEQPPAATTPAESNPPPSNNVAANNNNHTAKGYSVFVANLPMDATVEQLIQVFEQFGPIKPNSVQVRSYKQEKNCFGFVEFENVESMQSALQKSSVMIGNRKAHIEEKKANNDGGSRKFQARHGGSFRNDNYRSRGSFNGGNRSFGRNKADNQGGGFHSRGPARRNGEGNQKTYQDGEGVRGGGRQQDQSESEIPWCNDWE